MWTDQLSKEEPGQPPVAPATRHEAKIVPTPEDLQVTRLVVAVHGIGNQFRYSTVQAAARRFAAYCGRPITQPLGAFHPAKLITQPDSPELGAYLFEPPQHFEKEFSGFGFAEVFWADIPERAADTKNTTEESKAWAQTLVERVRLLDQSGTGKSDLIDYKKASAVVEEMIGTIKVLENLLSIAKKAGLFEFNLGQLLTDFLGDVQIVADFKDYGGDIFKRFGDTMKNLVRRMPNVDKIYIVAHSEGTVVSFKGLLTALAAQKGPDNEWVDKVTGYMTIGSPLNKHIVMWPNLWKGLKPAPGRTRQTPILWRNYYDYGDPVGFDLQITREWMNENGWLSFFQFGDNNDFGFTRYPFPGKAHNDYWNDNQVFGHFINEIVLGRDKAEKPQTIWWTFVVSRIVPYFLCLGLLAGGTYVLYTTLVAVFRKSEHVPVLGDVSGITCLLAGVTLLSRMPRLDKIWPGSVIGGLGFVLGTVAYLVFVSSGTQRLLSSAFWIPHGIIWIFLVIGLVSAGLSKLRPRWGMKPLIGLGGFVALMVLLKLLPFEPTALDHSLWQLILANAAFLYLWWLGALLFDLVYIWHRFICSYRTTETLRNLRAEAPSELQA
jgi:pimeloyl-ACP methyl ester carboxylesterase